MDSDFNWLHFVTEPDNLTGGIGDAHSFTALLTLPGNLVQHTKFCSEDGVPADWRQVTPQNSNSVDNVKFGVTMFPSDVAFVEREARFSSFAKGDQIPKARDVRGNEIPKATDSEAEDRDAESASSKKRKTEKKAVNSEPLESAKTKDVLNRKSKGKAEQRKRENDRNLKAPAVLEKQNYIHVRSRRGQATDSHSLAERACSQVRREKISERMKVLQDLVPGCNKITGKALMLDEIINHVQSLQHQVEFLSMKLATVNFKFHSDRDQMIAGVSPAFTGLPCHRFEPSLLQTVADVPCARDTELHHSRLQPPFPSGQSIPGHFPFSHLI